MSERVLNYLLALFRAASVSERVLNYFVALILSPERERAGAQL